MKPTSAVDLVVDTLAVARLVRFVQIDEMPVGAAREAILDVFGEAKPAELLRCPFCLAPYVAAFAVVARHRWPRAWAVASRVLASSLVAAVVVDRT